MADVLSSVIAGAPAAVAAAAKVFAPALERGTARRAKRHAALLRDLPSDVDAEPLSRLLSNELREIADRDAQRLGRRLDWTIIATMIGIIVVLGSLGGWLLTTDHVASRVLGVVVAAAGGILCLPGLGQLWKRDDGPTEA